MNYGNIAGFPQIIRNFSNLISGRSGQAFGIGTGIGTGINAVGNAIFGGGQQVCQTPQSMPYGVNKMTGCITVTRKQQQRLKTFLRVQIYILTMCNVIYIAIYLIGIIKILNL